MRRRPDVTISVSRKLEDLAAIAPDWNRLARREPRKYPQFEDIHDFIRDEHQDFCLVVGATGQDVVAIGCFVQRTSRRGFWLRNRKLFELPVRETSLQGSALLGDPDATLAAAMLAPILADPAVDFVNLGHVDKASSLYRAAQGLGWRWLRHETHWRGTQRIVEFPASFADYLANLRSSTRRSFKHEARTFQKLNPEFRVMTRPDEMRRFLTDATIIGDKTYQAGYPFGMDASEERLALLESRAADGRVVAILSYVEGMPVAYFLGEIHHEVFFFSYTGYDPAFRRSSPGTSIILFGLEYLMASGRTTRLDFSVRDLEYKARFATTSIDCAEIVLGRTTHPAAALSVLLDRASRSAKVFLSRLVGHHRRISKLQKTLRRPKRVKLQ